ncbi:uncharacterized protein LAESUDRAFT_729789 [Laetiporus sulphureus 93-53]|uniref:F-box domain-containing protein n=1 Tax=Laetiporus sulphureus 93-53 TaxID=1314785 RepID=A0A165CHH3_9APHY|nr:uncharacterized protein LAESUDRAFT_729789 [Laetiporus sulphureus 93-53]KZT02822.1 hypothetical protein LAESUDRAFT_729789 [Laetiporus sulphureus 93-53]
MAQVELPPEIWRQIMRYLPNFSRRTCLFVSMLVHDLAAEILFSTVNIHFGAWEHSPTPHVRGYALERARASASWNILQRIRSDPQFAKYVKKVIVYSYARHHAVFERCCLAETLGYLKDLRSFTWHGSSPKVSTGVLTALKESCPQLEELTIPIKAMFENRVDQFDNLRVMAFTTEDDDYVGADLIFNHSSDRERAQYRLNLESSSDALLALRTPYIAALHDSMHRFYQLTELDILNLKDMDLFAYILRNCEQLESFSILLNGAVKQVQLSDVLAQHTNSLPRLRFFKLITLSLDHTIDADVEILADFVRAKQELRRLLCTVYFSWDNIRPYLDAVSALKHLHTFALDVPGALDAASASCVRHYIPRHITALWLVFDSCERQLLRDIWTHFGDVRFAYVRLWEESNGFTVEDLVETTPQSQLVVLNGSFRHVERSGDPVQISPPWSARKVFFRSVDDFGCEDWEWLARHHEIVVE